MANQSTYYHSPIYGPIQTVDDLKAAIKLHWEEGEKIQSHYKRLEKGYSDWEDRLIAIENAITQLEDDAGLTKEELLAKPVKPPKEEKEFDLDEFLID